MSRHATVLAASLAFIAAGLAVLWNEAAPPAGPARAALADDGGAAARGGAAAAPAPAPRPQDPAPPADPGRWLLGDLHVHVSPPDVAGHSAYTVATAIDKARQQGLDFVVLAPHDADKSFGPSDETGGVPLFGQELMAKLAAEALAAPPPAPPPGSPAPPPPRPILVVPGWEFTRPWPGHQVLAFFRMEDVSKLEGDLKPARVVETGGLAVVAHPFFRPVRADPLFEKIVGKLGGWSGDWRWKPFFGDGKDPLAWNAIEVWHERSALVQRAHAHSAARHPETQMVRDALAAWDRSTKEQRRRIAGVGGSDCHGKPPYCMIPTRMVGVRVERFDEEALRAGLVGARVTFGRDGGLAVRDFAATSDLPGQRAGIGDALRAVSEVHLTWTGRATLVEDGAAVGEFDGGVTRKLDPPGSFRFWRIEKPADEAWSNMIYANLPR